MKYDWKTREAIRAKIAEARLQQSISQEALAEKVGVPQQNISRWENGSKTPTLENMRRLEIAFGMEKGELTRIVGWVAV